MEHPYNVDPAVRKAAKQPRVHNPRPEDMMAPGGEGSGSTEPVIEKSREEVIKEEALAMANRMLAKEKEK